MSRRQSGFTRASSLGPIADVLGRQGGSILRVLKDVDLPVALLEAPEMLVPLREQFRLLERAARTTGDPEFGARLGRDVRIKKLSAFGKWVSEADDLNGAIDRSKRGLNRMLQSSTELTLTFVGATAQWSIEFLDPECEGRYHNELLGLGYMIDAVRVYAGRDWARVAQHAADRIFQREAVAAVDLQRVVGRRPGDARGEQLGHAGLEVAAPALVLLARGEIGDLAGDHGSRPPS